MQSMIGDEKNASWIKFYRSFLEWEWWDNDRTLKFFIYCLLRANWKEGKWHGIKIPAGTFVSSYENMAKESKMTIQNVRTAIKHLSESGELKVESTHFSHKGETFVTVVNWEFFQGEEKVANKRLTRDQHATNKRLTNDQQTTNNNIRNKEYKERKEYIGSAEPEEDDIDYDEEGNVIEWITP